MKEDRANRGRHDDYIRYIDNVTILTNVGEEVELPNPIVAHMDDNSVREVWVDWEDKPIDVSEELELIFVGRVDGYALDVLCSIQVGKQTDNPESAFPECIDQFGLPKRDIQTEDVPHIDDYQYFKAKIPRTLVEEYHLKQLRETVADQVILARDINHMRNAIIEIEKYLWVVQDQLDDLFDRVEDLEDRVDWIEENMVIDGLNIGNGVGIFDSKRNRVLEFKSLTGEGIQIEDNGDEVHLVVEEQDGESGQGVCGINTVAKSFRTCHANDHLPVTVSDGMITFSEYFNWQMVKVRNTGEGAPYYFSLLGNFGMGTKMPVDGSSHGKPSSQYAGRFLKSTQNIIFEIKTSSSEYRGFIIGKDNRGSYTSGESYINREIYENIDVYSTDVAASKRAARYGYDNENDFDPEGGGDDDGGRDRRRSADCEGC